MNTGFFFKKVAPLGPRLSHIVTHNFPMRYAMSSIATDGEEIYELGN